MSDYYYNLEYVCEGVSITVKFNADVNVDEMQEYLKTLLTAASWNECNIAKIFNEEVENVEGN